MSIETSEHFVIMGAGRTLLRINMTEQSMVIIANETHPGMRHVIVASHEEAKNLRDWLIARFAEQ